MDLSVLIPTHGRPEKLARAIASLARQRFDGAFEVLVGVDGGAEGDGATGREVHAAARAEAGPIGDRLSVLALGRTGPGGVRNRLAERARGRVLLFLNDDVRAERDLLRHHGEAHAGRRGAAMILGAAPWAKSAGREETLFDRMVRETSLIFFYDRMEAARRAGTAGDEHDWGFRHAWTLNLSVPREVFGGVGGFDERLDRPMYEDLEFAWRVRRATGAPVLYRPGAVVQHDHEILPRDYLRRERAMGEAAWSFARSCPACARDVFGRDVASSEEIAFARGWLEREGGAAERSRGPFEALATIRGDAIPPLDDATGAVLMASLYQQHVPLKRLEWRLGLLAAAAAGAGAEARAA
ncbi:MAG: glycosyltransferase family 2 protein [Phycisphaerae bacterium]|nr:glycosyltransferase family 2 protein [Phycisphaerae bacterium]